MYPSILTSSEAVADCLRRIGVPTVDPHQHTGVEPGCLLVQNGEEVATIAGTSAEPLIIVSVNDAGERIEDSRVQDYRRYKLRTMRHILEMVLDLGRLVGRAEQAMEQVAHGERRLQAVLDASDRTALSRLRVLTLQSIDPVVAAGRWIPDMVQKAGGTPVGVEPGQDARDLSLEELSALQPDVILAIAGSEPVADLRVRLRSIVGAGGWPQIPAIQRKQVLFFDGARHFLTPGPEIVTTCLRLNVHLQDFAAQS